ncbi:MAG TPA: hypothetical protein VKE94_06895 [Gemmataceae bacterium]|nr:hypothetical protein [Gemmataceae bacterium]
MKLSHVLLLSMSILIGCGAIAASNLLFNRYEYSPVAVEGHLSRIDKSSGAVEIYVKDRGWVDVRFR